MNSGRSDYPAKKSGVPGGWTTATLGEVAEVTFSSVDKKIVDGEHPVLLCNYTDVFYNQRITPHMRFQRATATSNEVARWSLQRGDVVFTKDSETPNEIGVPAYVTETIPGVLYGYHLAIARPNPDLIEGSFLAEFLRSLTAIREFARIANGVTRFGLTLKATRSIPVLLPPLPEQRAIAHLLRSIDESIEKTEDVLHALQETKESTRHNLLEGRMSRLQSPMS